MAKRRFAVADGAAPLRRLSSEVSVRNAAAKVPRAADICIKASRSRHATTSPRPNTSASKAAGRTTRNSLPKHQGALLLKTETKVASASCDAANLPRSTPGALTLAAAPQGSSKQREPAKVSVLDMLRGSARPQMAGPCETQHSYEDRSLAAAGGAPVGCSSNEGAERSVGEGSRHRDHAPH